MNAVEQLEKQAANLAFLLCQKVTITNEDKLKAACIEAAMWLRQDAPTRALETLDNVLNRMNK